MQGTRAAAENVSAVVVIDGTFARAEWRPLKHRTDPKTQSGDDLPGKARRIIL